MYSRLAVWLLPVKLQSASRHGQELARTFVTSQTSARYLRTVASFRCGNTRRTCIDVLRL